jgi:hypothetical protein
MYEYLRLSCISKKKLIVFFIFRYIFS